MKDIYKSALKLAVPMMIQNGITNAVGLVDNVMVGSLGTNAVTAVSITGQLIFVFSLAVFGGLSGPGIYAAQYYGQKNMQGFQDAFRIKHWICAFCVLAGLAVFTLAPEPLIGLYMKGESGSVDPSEVMRLSKDYLFVMLIGLAPFAVTQIYAGSLRETGHSFMPMLAGVISVAADVVFNYLLIFGKAGFPEMGVKGAAAATVISRFAEMAIIVTCSMLRREKYTFLSGAYRTMLVKKDRAANIIKKGLPIFFNEFLWAAGIAALTQIYSVKGLDYIAGINISNTLCNLLNVVFIALGNAVGIIIGQMLGASQYEEAQKSSFRLMFFTGAACAALTAVLIALSGIFPRFYDTTPEIRAFGQKFIVITALFFPVQGFLNALYFTLRSGGKTVITFLFDSIFSWAVTIPVAALLCRFTSLDIFAVYAMIQAVDIIKVAIGSVLIGKGLWLSNIAVQS